MCNLFSATSVSFVLCAAIARLSRRIISRLSRVRRAANSQKGTAGPQKSNTATTVSPLVAIENTPRCGVHLVSSANIHPPSIPPLSSFLDSPPPSLLGGVGGSFHPPYLSSSFYHLQRSRRRNLAPAGGPSSYEIESNQNFLLLPRGLI